MECDLYFRPGSFILNLRAISKYKPPGAYIWRGNLMEGFCVMSLGGLYLEGFIHRGAYFFNFTVLLFLILVEHSLTLKIQLFFSFV